MTTSCTEGFSFSFLPFSTPSTPIPPERMPGVGVGLRSPQLRKSSEGDDSPGLLRAGAQSDCCLSTCVVPRGLPCFTQLGQIHLRLMFTSSRFPYLPLTVADTPQHHEDVLFFGVFCESVKLHLHFILAFFPACKHQKEAL